VYFFIFISRQGLSREEVTREMCNVWKSDRLVASIVLQERLGQFIASITGWQSVRLAQDDLIWKAPRSTNASIPSSVVGFHQDAAYISNQFEPLENNSVTVWMALDDVDDETGCVQYVPGSHLWRLEEVRNETAKYVCVLEASATVVHIHCYHAVHVNFVHSVHTYS
jgi:ectoine hydroxylase-related dioxygenase (phytanoyl-CoA dioxygenase family)